MQFTREPRQLEGGSLERDQRPKQVEQLGRWRFGIPDEREIALQEGRQVVSEAVVSLRGRTDKADDSYQLLKRLAPEVLDISLEEGGGRSSENYL